LIAFGEEKSMSCSLQILLYADVWSPFILILWKTAWTFYKFLVF